MKDAAWLERFLRRAAAYRERMQRRRQQARAEPAAASPAAADGARRSVTISSSWRLQVAPRAGGYGGQGYAKASQWLPLRHPAEHFRQLWDEQIEGFGAASFKRARQRQQQGGMLWKQLQEAKKTRAEAPKTAATTAQIQSEGGGQGSVAHVLARQAAQLSHLSADQRLERMLALQSKQEAAQRRQLQAERRRQQAAAVAAKLAAQQRAEAEQRAGPVEPAMPEPKYKGPNPHKRPPSRPPSLASMQGGRGRGKAMPRPPARLYHKVVLQQQRMQKKKKR